MLKFLGGENVKNKIKKIAVVALAVMSVLIVSILPCSAVTVPNYNISDDDYNYYTIIKFESGQENIYLSHDELVVFHEGDSYSLNTHNNSWAKPIINKTAAVDATGTLATFSSVKGKVIQYGQIIAANYDVKYQGSDEVFFQQPTLLSQLLSLVPGAGEKITGDLGILTTCGIGCLALLIGLSLLPKVLYKFL